MENKTFRNRQKRGKRKAILRLGRLILKRRIFRQLPEGLGLAQKPDMKEVTGAFWEGKQAALVRCSEPSKKSDLFLDSPFNG